MAIAYMTRINIPEYDERIENKAWEYTDTLTSAVNGDTVILPIGIENITVTLEITGSGSGKIQTTTNTLADVESGTSVIWVDWDGGVVSSTTQDVAVTPVTAIRQVNASGTSRMMIRAQ